MLSVHCVYFSGLHSCMVCSLFLHLLGYIPLLPGSVPASGVESRCVIRLIIMSVRFLSSCHASISSPRASMWSYPQLCE